MKAPERIWADPPSLFDGVDLWHEKQDGAELTAVEYIRKDASDVAIAAARADAEKWQKAFAAQTRKLQAAMDAGGDAVRQAIRAAAEAQP